MIEEKIKQLGYVLPDAPKPLAAYVPSLKINDLVFTAGQVPMVKGEIKYTGKLGRDLNEDEGKKAAIVCALNCLSVVKAAAGSLENIEQIVKLTVFVNGTDEFTKQPFVANGASELMVELFGDKGKHARSAVGVNGLPMNAAVEIEMIVKVK